uniref:T-box transcription factor T n=1 Tax=Myxine glutinosa TaxID=7769 RepID=UPI00358E9AAD
MGESNGEDPPSRLEQLLSAAARESSEPSDKSETSERDVRVVLEERVLWEQFHALTNEMIVTKTGRRMFPVIKVSVSGLDPHAMYSLLLDFSAADAHRWKYVNGEWVAGGKPEPQPPSCVYIHPDSPNFGAHWMRAPVSFCKVKLSNKMNGSGQIMLNSLHKYQPRMHIVRVGGPQRLLSSHAFPETRFIAVTAYQNEEITTLKIRHNPFAKAFLDAKERSDPHKDGPNDISDVQQSAYAQIGGWLLPGQQQFPGAFSLPGASACERFPPLRAHRAAPYPSPHVARAPHGYTEGPGSNLPMLGGHDAWTGLPVSSHAGMLHHSGNPNSSQYLWSMAGGSMSPVPQAMPTGLPMPFFRGNSSPYPGGPSSTLHGASPSSYDAGGHGGDTVVVDSPYDPTAHLLTTWAPLTPPDM